MKDATMNERTQFYTKEFEKHGIEKQTIQQIFDSMKTITGQDSQEVLADWLKTELKALHIKTTDFETAEQLKFLDPDAYDKAMKSFSDSVKNRDMTKLFGDKFNQLKSIIDKFNEIAKDVGGEHFDAVDLSKITIENSEDVREKLLAFAKDIEEKIVNPAAGSFSYGLDTNIMQAEQKLRQMKKSNAPEDKIKAFEEDIKFWKSFKQDYQNVYQNSIKSYKKIIDEIMNTAPIFNEALKGDTDRRSYKIQEDKDTMMKNANADRYEVEILDQKIRGNQQLVHLLEMQNILRKQGIIVNKENLKIYRDELDELLKQQSRTKTVALKGDLFERTKDNKVGLYKLMGDETRANRLQMLMSAEKTAGRPLNQYETALVNRLADITGSINRFSMPQPKDSIIHTNELAAKGGFSKSVAVERADNGKLQLRMQQAIHRLFIENNKLQQKIAESLVN